LPFQVPLAEARLGAEAAAHGAVVHAFQRHAAEIYGIDDMPAPPITPLPVEPVEPVGADDTTPEDPEEKQ
ncbi:ROK family transcriptional regulator, partial [Microbacterium sp. AGC62]